LEKVSGKRLNESNTYDPVFFGSDHECLDRRLGRCAGNGANETTDGRSKAFGKAHRPE
jgi:hypothetical protein